MIPSPKQRDLIQEIQSQLAAGRMEARFREFFRELLASYEEVDAVVLGCTELPLAIGTAEAPQPLLNPIELQCAEAVDFALGSSKA